MKSTMEKLFAEKYASRKASVLEDTENVKALDG